MQVIASTHARRALPRHTDIALAIGVGAVLVFASVSVSVLLVSTGVLGSVLPTGRLTAGQVVLGGLAWAAALAVPGLFAVVGVARIAAGVEGLSARRPRPSPVQRAAASVSDDHVAALGVHLPDGSRVIPELVIGPFGAAVFVEAPPGSAVLARGPRSWEVRTADGRRRTIEDPRERAARDAERVRRWFGGEDRDHVVKVYAAVIATEPIDRTPLCAVLGPLEVAAWLAALPAQRTFDEVRRERIIALVRSAT
jgi:hypothetical protein